MRLKAALAAAILLLAGAPVCAAPAVRHVFFVDRSTIERRYLGDADLRDTADEAGMNRVRALDADLATATALVAPAHGGNVVLERSAVVFMKREADITPLVAAMMDKSWTPVAKAPALRAVADVQPLGDPAIVVADLDKVRAAVPDKGDREPRLARELAEIAVERHADLVVRHQATIMGLLNVDVTADLTARLTGAKMGLIGPQGTPRIAVVDRGRVLKDSLVGKSIVAQVGARTDDAVADIKNRVASGMPQETALRYADERQAAIRAGFFAARTAVEDKLGPILQDIMEADHVDVLLDNSAVPFDSVDPDLTEPTDRELDATFPTVTVTVAPPPK
jgi:hypothetical protein